MYPPRAVSLPVTIRNGMLSTMTPTIDKAGRLVVPKAVREAVGLRPGTRVRFLVRHDRVEIAPVPRDVVLERRGSGVVAVPREERQVLTAGEVEETKSALRRRTPHAEGTR